MRGAAVDDHDLHRLRLLDRRDGLATISPSAKQGTMIATRASPSFRSAMLNGRKPTGHDAQVAGASRRCRCHARRQPCAAGHRTHACRRAPAREARRRPRGRSGRAPAAVHGRAPEAADAGRGPAVLDIVVRQLRAAGFERVTIATGYLAELIEAFFRDGSAYGVRDRLLPRGRAARHRRARWRSIDGPRRAVPGDERRRADRPGLRRALRRDHVASGAAATIATTTRDDRASRSASCASRTTSTARRG